MKSAGCPGQDRRYWKPEDIFECDCPHCNATMEFWKTDIRVKCQQCGGHVFNPRFNLGCALWCTNAAQCVGDISSIYTERPETLRDRLELELRRYFIGEWDRLKFTLEAEAIALRLLAEEKGADPLTVIAAVLLHDAGYMACKEYHNEDAGLKLCIPEKSVELAGKIMDDLKIPPHLQDKVKKLIAGSSAAEDADVNAWLFLDIIDLTAGKLAAAAGKLPAAAAADLLQKLQRQSSRELAASIIVEYANRGNDLDLSAQCN